jgi:hypothetical protein
MANALYMAIINNVNILNHWLYQRVWRPHRLFGVAIIARRNHKINGGGSSMASVASLGNVQPA